LFAGSTPLRRQGPALPASIQEVRRNAGFFVRGFYTGSREGQDGVVMGVRVGLDSNGL
jgi:hypothetical protein